MGTRIISVRRRFFCNPNNPNPEQWVGWGDRTVDEMAHAWVDVTYLEQDNFDALQAERQEINLDD